MEKTMRPTLTLAHAPARFAFVSLLALFAAFGPSAVRASQPGEAGESGGEHHHATADDKLSPEVKLYRDLELVRGHLLVADELIAGGHWIDAVPHVFHPIEELYEGMKGEIDKRGLAAFLPELKALGQTVKAKEMDAYSAAAKIVTAKLDAVETGLKSGSASWSATVKEATVAALKTAVEEYGEAVKDEKIAEAVEYQDSRGFVWRAEAMLKNEALTKSDSNKPALASAQEAISKLKTAWPGAMPPEKAAMTVAEVKAGVGTIEKILEAVR